MQTDRRADGPTGRPHRLVDNSSDWIDHFSNDDQRRVHADIKAGGVESDSNARTPQESSPLNFRMKAPDNLCKDLTGWRMIEQGVMFAYSEGSGIS